MLRLIYAMLFERIYEHVLVKHACDNPDDPVRCTRPDYASDEGHADPCELDPKKCRVAERGAVDGRVLRALREDSGEGDAQCAGEAVASEALEAVVDA